MFPRSYVPNRGPMPAGPLQFVRRLDGAVEVWREALHNERIAGYDGPQYRRMTVISANSWASLVSSLTADGENALTFGLMLHMHSGGCAYDPDAAKFDADGPMPPTMEQWAHEHATRCPIAGVRTAGHFYCTRRRGHDGPCAPVPVTGDGE